MMNGEVVVVEEEGVMDHRQMDLFRGEECGKEVVLTCYEEEEDVIANAVGVEVVEVGLVEEGGNGIWRVVVVLP